MARILVVDDRRANRDLVAYLLGYYGHNVATASDGAEAVEAAAIDKPDLVVMDVAMPGMDGYTAVRLMRSRPALRDVPMVAVSATSLANATTAREAGFDDFYPLPIDPERFVELLEPYLGRSPVRPRAGGTESRCSRRSDS